MNTRAFRRVLSLSLPCLHRAALSLPVGKKGAGRVSRGPRRPAGTEEAALRRGLMTQRKRGGVLSRRPLAPRCLRSSAPALRRAGAAAPSPRRRAP